MLLSTTKPLIHHMSNISEVVALIASRCSALLEAEEIDNTIEDRGEARETKQDQPTYSCPNFKFVSNRNFVKGLG